jgi:hypothetical protein
LAFALDDAIVIIIRVGGAIKVTHSPPLLLFLDPNPTPLLMGAL